MALGPTIGRLFSHVDYWPGWSRLTPPLARVPMPEELRGFAAAQRLATRCAQETEKQLRTGITERELAAWMRDWLASHGVEHYFHRPFVWFGPRTRFRHFTTRLDLRATEQTLAENDVYIFDFAPVLDGYACDFSYAGQWGTVPGYVEARAVLDRLYRDIPGWVAASGHRADRLWQRVHQELTAHSLSGIHETSSYSFLGHRVHHVAASPLARALAHRGAQTLLEFFARGASGQVLTRHHQGDMTGLWAVEPHLAFGDHAVKFEELLLVTPTGATWLRDAAV
ncbi:M24 family metallopeptidase [Cystobacter fuscus]|nr:M24 family metallopeptidase [Cystobacter fuscus]